VGVFYKAYCDASGGAAGGDAYCIAIAHREQGRYIVDVVRGRQGPFEPVELTKEYAALCKQYHCHGVVGDKYGLEWVASAWRGCGMAYTPATLTASETYCETLPLFTRALVALPPHPTLERELRLLERSPTRLGREQVTHPRGCHDDYANVCCGVLRSLASYLGYDLQALAAAFGDDPDDGELSYQEQERQRRYDELLKRYGQPIPSPFMAREDIEVVRAKDALPEQVREAIHRPRAAAALLRSRPGHAAHGVSAATAEFRGGVRELDSARHFRLAELA